MDCRQIGADVTFCSVCGAYSSTKLYKLRDRCTGPAQGAALTRLKSFQRLRHPILGYDLKKPHRATDEFLDAVADRGAVRRQLYDAAMTAEPSTGRAATDETLSPEQPESEADEQMGRADASCDDDARGGPEYDEAIHGVYDDDEDVFGHGGELDNGDVHQMRPVPSGQGARDDARLVPLRPSAHHPCGLAQPTATDSMPVIDHGPAESQRADEHKRKRDDVCVLDKLAEGASDASEPRRRVSCKRPALGMTSQSIGNGGVMKIADTGHGESSCGDTPVMGEHGTIVITDNPPAPRTVPLRHVAAAEANGLRAVPRRHAATQPADDDEGQGSEPSKSTADAVAMGHGDISSSTGADCDATDTVASIGDGGGGGHTVRRRISLKRPAMGTAYEERAVLASTSSYGTAENACRAFGDVDRSRACGDGPGGRAMAIADGGATDDADCGPIARHTSAALRIAAVRERVLARCARKTALRDETVPANSGGDESTVTRNEDLSLEVPERRDARGAYARWAWLRRCRRCESLQEEEDVCERATTL